MNTLILDQMTTQDYINMTRKREVKVKTTDKNPCFECLMRPVCKSYCEERIEYFNRGLLASLGDQLEIRRYENGDDT